MIEPLQFLQKSHRRRTLKTVVECVKRATRLGNYWYWMEAPELENGIDIASLICPLRYDVIVRRDFLTFYTAHRDLYRSDFNAFVDLVKQGSYYTWFVKSESIRTKPHLLDDPDGLWIRFVDKIRKAAELYESMVNGGFDEQFPIILKTAEHLLPPTGDRRAPPTGKFLSDRYFLADGCHRLATLMTMGYNVLPYEYFRIMCFREFNPFDSTSLLARSLPITPSAYFTFLSSRYCHPFVFEDRDSFLEYLKVHKPKDVDELLSVIRVDGFDTETAKNKE